MTCLTEIWLREYYRFSDHFAEIGLKKLKFELFQEFVWSQRSDLIKFHDNKHKENIHIVSPLKFNIKCATKLQLQAEVKLVQTFETILNAMINSRTVLEIHVFLFHFLSLYRNWICNKLSFSSTMYKALKCVEA